MTDTTREAVARAIYDEIEGPVNNQDFTRQTRQWELAQRLADAALAALRPAQDAEGWRDIASAPKDGTRILAWSEEYGQRETFMAKYKPGSYGFELWGKGQGPLDVGWRWDEPKNNWSLTWSPTHWMPLPASPPRTLEGK